MLMTTEKELWGFITVLVLVGVGLGYLGAYLFDHIDITFGIRWVS